MEHIFSTNRLLIKYPEIDDARDILNFYNNNREIFELYETDRPFGFYTIEHQKTLIRLENRDRTFGKFVRFYVFAKHSPNDIIGTISFSGIVGGSFKRAIIGYKFDERYWHQGFATEAVSACLNHICTTMSLHRIEAYVLAENEPSVRLLNRLHFDFEATARDYVKLRGKYTDMHRYVYLADN